MFKNSGRISGLNGVSLLSGRFHSDDDQANFESLAGVDPLPDSGTISADQAATIAAIGLTSVTASSTTSDVRALARAHYVGML